MPKHDFFYPGDRVKVHPATVAFIQGDRYGTVRQYNQFGNVLVLMDRTGMHRTFHPDNISRVEEQHAQT